MHLQPQRVFLFEMWPCREPVHTGSTFRATNWEWVTDWQSALSGAASWECPTCAALLKEWNTVSTARASRDWKAFMREHA